MAKSLNDKKAEIFKALANPVRLDIIDQLLDGEKCVCEIQENLKKYQQAHISKSLQKLKSVGLIKDKRVGMNVYYSLAICCMSEFFGCLNKILKDKD
ncbi:MAG: metalloregulator ArsR/SmtB family transcription factor [bacterium]|nr:metalloregulator ArsR/SmtB family transcription factor [bacterium]